MSAEYEELLSQQRFMPDREGNLTQERKHDRTAAIAIFQGHVNVVEVCEGDFTSPGPLHSPCLFTLPAGLRRLAIKKLTCCLSTSNTRDALSLILSTIQAPNA
jgi:hypothetical protein